MLTEEFNYHLPEELIAQNPVSPRDHSRLMVVNRADQSIEHRYFYELAEILKPTDVLVLNQSKVIPARLYGKIIGAATNRSAQTKQPAISERPVEILLLKALTPNRYEALVKPGKKFTLNTQIKFNANLRGQVNKIYPNGQRLIEFNLSGKALAKAIEKSGHAPLPPYIKHSTATLQEYQTIYAKEKGSVAAPTAGLHFTAELFQKLHTREIQTEFVTLHVGLGTFAPVKTEKIEDHPMHNETFSLPATIATRLNQAKKQGQRIIAVGTTSTRILETCAAAGTPTSKTQTAKTHTEKTPSTKPHAQKAPQLTPQTSQTDIFIYPGYQWKFLDALITNFHLPKSTLLMLVSSFAGSKFIQKAYQEAIRQKYRFYSFGDAMLIV